MLEALPDHALDVTLHFLANIDRAALIQLARASSCLYAPAIAMAIRTAPAFWPLISMDPATGQPLAYLGHSSHVMSNSSVRELCVSFDISLRSREWNKPAVLRASQWLMNHGLPRGLMTLRLDGLWGPYIGGGEDIPPYMVAWPVSLRHLYLNLGHAYGNESVVVAQLLTSLATAKVPNLVTLDVTGANFDQVIVADAIVAALPATLTTLRLAQYYPRRPKPEDTEHLCPVFHAIADKCPRLQSLHVEPKILFESNELAVLARDTIPLLRAMTKLSTLALVTWDLTAADHTFWVALADAVPHLMVLDLSQNQNLDDGVVNQLEPLIQHSHLRRLVMMGTTLSREGRVQLSAMIQQAQWVRRVAAVQKKCGALGVV
ncbi:hypothetical protein AMAG_16547 [Allomyces macrogynus ATCC 38327]|uniref:F-box domain-containing protein n=1 Tax=Allomyces macrogynus (strain ATCC 38327) TaxID=578462 RepID=A0A0L0TD97_ALLM3|nr:hypothetical protein AMAG_16547 [Allomyces macrogynus ATCC 38327]|eukprot:KNE72504.1 hypothetical protein AMAG_16547 [Allomyces macrogynus ATCC 38327]